LWTSGAATPDDRRLAAVSLNGHVLVVRGDGRAVVSWRAPGAVLGVALSADGRRLVALNGNGTVSAFRLPGLA
jgi:hypothetical protein